MLDRSWISPRGGHIVFGRIFRGFMILPIWCKCQAVLKSERVYRYYRGACIEWYRPRNMVVDAACTRDRRSGRSASAPDGWCRGGGPDHDREAEDGPQASQQRPTRPASTSCSPWAWAATRKAQGGIGDPVEAQVRRTGGVEVAAPTTTVRLRMGRRQASSGQPDLLRHRVHHGPGWW